MKIPKEPKPPKLIKPPKEGNTDLSLASQGGSIMKPTSPRISVGKKSITPLSTEKINAILRTRGKK